jgi:undecaprenyl-diphosphatase
MDVGKAVILGIVQGLTEFLPVSSSGHLVLGKHFLGLVEQGIIFEVFVHFGTLLAVFTVFWQDILKLVQSFFGLFASKNRDLGIKQYYEKDEHLRILTFIILGTIPAAFVGLLFQDKIESAFNNPRFACAMLIVTAFILSLTIFVKKTGKELTMRNTFLMGIAQALAIIPGISRSGSTISAGLFQNIDGDKAARFSFLLAIPAILGATVLKSVELVNSELGGDMFMILSAGMIASYISGFIAIESMLAVVKRGKLYYFAPYCLILGVLGLIFL